MKWRDIHKELPQIGQYSFMKNEEKESLGVWTGREFAVILGEVPDNKELWSPAFYRGKYIDIPGTRGELEFVPSGVYDEDGNEWESPK